MNSLQFIKGNLILNENNCRKIEESMSLGMEISDAYCKEIKRNRIDPRKVTSIQNRTDKWYWIILLLKYEQQNCIQSL